MTTAKTSYKVTIFDGHETNQHEVDAVNPRDALEQCLSEYDYGEYSADLKYHVVPAYRCGNKSAAECCRFGDVVKGISDLGGLTMTGTDYEID